MSDIGRRIQRYRLSRYAAPEDRVRRRLRWAWLVAALWIVWVAFLSDHNFYRLWQLAREDAHARGELARMRDEVAKLDDEAADPAARRRHAEVVARERDGMARPGEYVYRIEEGRSGGKTPAKGAADAPR